MSNLKIYRRIPLVGPRDGICLYIYKSDIVLCVTCAENQLSGTITVALVIGVLAVLAVGLPYYPSIMNIAAFGQGAVQLSAKLVGSDFKWINTANGETNPTLILKANTPQTIQIQNPTQAMHQLVIDFNGKQVATSGDIAAGSSGQL